MLKFAMMPGAFFSALAGLVANDMRRMIGPSVPIEPAAPGFRKRGRSRGRKMMKNPPNHTGWFQRHAAIRPMPVTERMLMRHGFYRRQLRKRGIELEAVAKNAMVLK